MKSLSLSRPLVIMMLGTPGAGKSFFARQFSETFNAPLVSFDRLRYELFAEPHYVKDEETIIQRIALSQISELLKTQKTFIVDGGMSTRIDRAEIEKLAKKHTYSTLIIWVQTDPATAKTRSLRRNPTKAFDEYNTPLSDEIFEKLSKKITPPSLREAVIVVSGKHTYATQAKMVLKKLISPRETATIDVQNENVTPIRTGRDDHPQAPPVRRSVTIR